MAPEPTSRGRVGLFPGSVLQGWTVPPLHTSPDPRRGCLKGVWLNWTICVRRFTWLSMRGEEGARARGGSQLFPRSRVWNSEPSDNSKFKSSLWAYKGICVNAKGKATSLPYVTWQFVNFNYLTSMWAFICALVVALQRTRANLLKSSW